MRLALLLAAVVLAPGVRAQTAGPEGESFPYMHDEALDGAFDGTFALPVVVAGCAMPDLAFRMTAPLPAHAEPRATSPVVRTVAAGTPVARAGWDRAITVTVRPAVFRARRKIRFEAITSFGRIRTFDFNTQAPERPVRVVIGRGDTFEVLSLLDGTIGFALVRIGGVVYLCTAINYYGNSVEPFTDDAAVQEKPLEDEIWIRLVAEPGQPAAWVQGEKTGGSGPDGLVPVCPGDAAP